MEVELHEAAAAEGLRQLEQACLPTSLEWHVWWNERQRFVEMTFGWERAICDSITRLQKNQITLARMVRNTGAAKSMIRYNSDGYIEGEEYRAPDEITREALVWFITQVKPSVVRTTPSGDTIAAPGVPEWAVILARGVEGCFLQQARLGLELGAIRRKGYLTLNHSATVKNPESFKDDGMEVL